MAERARGIARSGKIAGLLILLLVLPAAASAQRQVTDETGRHITIPAHPHRLVSLAPSITETLYALGFGNELVGDTNYCDYPPQARQKPHVGALLNPSLEAIVALKPDLVLGQEEANRLETAQQLARLGIPLYGLSARSVDDMLRSIVDLGDILDCPARADALAGRLRARVEAVERRVAGRPKPKVLFVVWYRPLISAGAHTFISDVIRLAGGDPLTAGLRGEWPRLSLEEVLARNPDVILFPRTDAMAPSLEKFRRMSVWKDCRAVREGKVYFVPDSINRPSPRLIDALEDVARLLHPPASAGEARR